MAGDPADIQVERQAGVHLVRVRGVIDERFDRASLAQVLTAAAASGDAILVDVEGVPRITSYGVREWSLGFRAGTTAPVYFVGVRPALVAQFNSVRQFGSAGFIVSLYCPYVCDACGKDFEILTDVRKHGDQLRASQAPAATCPACGKAASFDDVEQSYFAALVERPLPPLPPAIEAALDGARPSTLRPLRVAKTVTDTVTALWLVGALDQTARFKRHADGLEGYVVVILDNVVGADAAGLTKLAELLRTESAHVSLARVPLAVARRLHEDSAAAAAVLGQACVVSAVADALCPRCGEVTVDVTVAVRSGGAAPCPGCGDPVELDIDVAYASLPWGDAPPPVASFLAKHPTLDAAMPAMTEDSGRLQRSPGAAPGSAQGSAPGSFSVPPTSIGGTHVGKFEILRRIGMGGMAEVFLGRQTGIEGFEKKVVIKRILPHLAVQPSFVEQFLEEARVAARITHPNVVQIFDLARDDQNYFIVMEFVSGHDFNALIRMANRLRELIPIGIACRVVAGLCAGLHAAHTYTTDTGVRMPVLHRDVSPHNVLVGIDGAVKVTDFGVAKATGTLGETNGSKLKGKVLYMAPEHILGQRADARVDVFAAGLCLYYALVQVHPFARSSEVAALKAVLEADIKPPSALRPEIPAELDRIVMAALERDPAKRTQSAAEMADHLERFLATQADATFPAVGAWARSLDERIGAAMAHAPSSRGDVNATITTPEYALEREAISARVKVRAVANGAPIAVSGEDE